MKFFSHFTLNPVQRGLWVVISLHVILWTAIPLLSGYAPALDAIEMHSWSLAWQWGYYKHPPLPAWIVALTEVLVGKTSLALILPSVLSIVLCYLAIGKLAHQLLQPKLAVVALFLSSTSLFYQLWAVGFNHNVVQIPLWAWTVTCLYQALLRGYKTDWFILGLVYGLTLLAKYTAVLLVPPAILFICLTPSVKQRLRWSDVLWMLFGAILILSPHGLWLIQHHFESFHYATTRLSGVGHWGRSFLGFIGTAVFAHSALLIAWASVVWRGSRLKKQVQQVEGMSDNGRFLVFLGFGPFVLACIIGLTGKTLAPMWAMAMLPLCGVALVYWLSESALKFYRPVWLSAWLIFQLLVVTAFWMKGSVLYSQLSKRSLRANYPVVALAQTVQTHWQHRFPGRPLRYVVGPIWEAGVVSFYIADTPYVIPDGDFSATPWISRENIKAYGAVLLNPSAETLARFAHAEIQPKLILPATLPNMPQVELTWAWVAPGDSGE